MKRLLLFILPALTLLLPACGPKLEGSGEVISQKRSIEAFSQIQVKGPLTVIVVPGEQHSAEILADDNLHPYISMVVNKKGVLHLEVTQEPRNFSKMEVHLQVPQCERISTAENSSLRLEGPWTLDGTQLVIREESQLKAQFKNKSIALDARDDAQVQAAGVTQTAQINAAGKAKLQLRDLKIDDAILTASGKSELQVMAGKTLSVEASDKAVITYSGKAKVVKSAVEDDAVLQTR